MVIFAIECNEFAFGRGAIRHPIIRIFYMESETGVSGSFFVWQWEILEVVPF
jgi:hypothetical protein